MTATGGVPRPPPPADLPPPVRRSSIQIPSEQLAGEGAKFNGCLVRHEGRLLLSYRAIHRFVPPVFRWSRIYIAGLSEDYRPLWSKALRVPEQDRLPPDASIEDPRLFAYRGQLYCTYVVCTHNWDRARQEVTRLDAGYDAAAPFVPPRHRHPIEKNQVFFESEGGLYCVYAPHELHVLGERAFVQVTRWPLMKWPYGVPHGSTAPALFRGEWYSFFHSFTLPADNPFWTFRHYHVGVYTFEARPPFRVLRYTPHPILSARDESPKAANLPHVIFPSGAFVEGDRWVVSAGINDSECRILHVPVEEIESRLRPYQLPL